MQFFSKLSLLSCHLTLSSLTRDVQKTWWIQSWRKRCVVGEVTLCGFFPLIIFHLLPLASPPSATSSIARCCILYFISLSFGTPPSTSSIICFYFYFFSAINYWKWGESFWLQRRPLRGKPRRKPRPPRLTLSYVHYFQSLFLLFWWVFVVVLFYLGFWVRHQDFKNPVSLNGFLGFIQSLATCHFLRSHLIFSCMHPFKKFSRERICASRMPFVL